MTLGRPRIYDYDQEGKELDEWSKKDDSLALQDFTSEKPYLAQDLTDFAKRSEGFALALNKAKERIGRRREKQAAAGTMYFGVWNRTARLYDKLLINQENEDADADAERKKGSNITLQINGIQKIIDANPEASKELVDEST